MPAVAQTMCTESTGTRPPLGPDTVSALAPSRVKVEETAVPAASAAGWMSSSSTTPPSSFHCPSVCCVWHQHKPHLITKMPKTFFYAQRPQSKNPESRKVLKVWAIKKAKDLRAHCLQRPRLCFQYPHGGSQPTLLLHPRHQAHTRVCMHSCRQNTHSYK